MKLLINNNGAFAWIETPDMKIYKVHELKDCTIPPLFVLYENQLFQFRNIDINNDINTNYWVYGSITNESENIYAYLSYNVSTGAVECNNSIEYWRLQYQLSHEIAPSK